MTLHPHESFFSKTPNTMTTTDYPPRHIPSFRPLVPSEQWHRLDWTPDMLPDGTRPLMLGEPIVQGDAFYWQICWNFVKEDFMPAQTWHGLHRTRRPLPPPPPTFEHDGKTWNSHVPGDPCPVDGNVLVEVLFASGQTGKSQASYYNWEPSFGCSIIGYRLADEPSSAPSNTIKALEGKIQGQALELHIANEEIARLRRVVGEKEARVAELERELHEATNAFANEMRDCANLREELASALTPRPISEAGELREGFVRLYGAVLGSLGFSLDAMKYDTHFLDIHLPVPTEREQFEAELAKHNGDHFAMWQSTKGGVA